MKSLMIFLALLVFALAVLVALPYLALRVWSHDA